MDYIEIHKYIQEQETERKAMQTMADGLYQEAVEWEKACTAHWNNTVQDVAKLLDENPYDLGDGTEAVPAVLAMSFDQFLIAIADDTLMHVVDGKAELFTGDVKIATRPSKLGPVSATVNLDIEGDDILPLLRDDSEHSLPDE